MIYRMNEARKLRLNFDPFAKGFTDAQLNDAYYRMTCDPNQNLLILESAPGLAEMEAEYGGEEATCDGCFGDCGSCGQTREDGMVLEAVRVRAFSRTAQTMAALGKALNRYMADKGLTVGAAEIGKPRKSGLFATVTVQFPVSDGQSITIVFHSPDGNKLQITAQDELLAFRWLLNKRDITVAVSPEGEADVSLEEVGKRVAMLVEKNAKAFASKSKEIADQKQALADVQAQVATAQAENQTLLASLTETQAQSEQLDTKIQTTQEQLAKVQEFNAGLQTQIAQLQATKAGNDGKGSGTRPADWETKTVYSEDYTGPRFKYGLQYRPFGIATVPKGSIIGTLNENDHPETSKGKARHGTIEYPFPLTDDEVRSFELLDLTGKAEDEEAEAFKAAKENFDAELQGRGFQLIDGIYRLDNVGRKGISLYGFLNSKATDARPGSMLVNFALTVGTMVDGKAGETKALDGSTIASLDKITESALRWIDKKMSELMGGDNGDDAKYQAAVASFRASLESIGFKEVESQSFRFDYVGNGSNGKPMLLTLSTNYYEDGGKIKINTPGSMQNFTANSKATAANAFGKALEALTALVEGKQTVDQWAAQYQGTVGKFRVGDWYKISRNLDGRGPADDYMDGFKVKDVNDSDFGGSQLPAVSFQSEHSSLAIRYDLLQPYLDGNLLVPSGPAAPKQDPVVVAVYAGKGSKSQITITQNGDGSYAYSGDGMGGGLSSVQDIVRSIGNWRLDTPSLKLVSGTDFEAMAAGGGGDGGNPEETAAVAILNGILAGEYADSGSISDALDQAASNLEGAGLMDKYDGLLNQAADYLTSKLREEAA